jgi:esterase/lipase superfamily enzyme
MRTRICSIAAVLALQILTGLHHGAFAIEPIEGIEHLARQLAEGIQEGKSFKLVVADLPDLEGPNSDLGRLVAERLATRLSGYSREFQVAERRRLGQALYELRFGMSDLLDPTKAKQVGKMLDVDALVLVTVKDLGDEVQATARIIEIETNLRLAAGSSAISKKDLAVRQIPEKGYTAGAPYEGVTITMGHDYYGTEFPPAGSHVYPVWYGTNRVPVDPQDQKKGYTSQPDSINHYGKCFVVIPKSHEFGSVGSAWYRRFLKGDDRLWVREVIPLTEDSFLKDIRDTLAKESLSDRSLLVYIHGYHVTFEEAAIRAAQIGFDLKVPGITAFYSWPSQGTLDGYGADYDMVQISEEDLSRFLVRMAKDSNANRVHIVAHSMGNQGLLRALYRSTAQAAITAGMRFGQIFLAAPDVDVDLFRQLANVYPTVAERTTMYVSAKDKVLGISSMLRKDRPRAGYTPPTTTVDGIDTVEATGIDVTILGHAYFAEAAGILYDMHELLFHNTPPERRPRLFKHTTSAGVPYWVVK